MTLGGLAAVACAAAWAISAYGSSSTVEDLASVALPQQAVLADPRTFAVMGENASFRTDAFSTFNPTNTTPPFFQVINQGFLSILGSSPSIQEIAGNDTFAFAHEAPIFVPETEEVFFASNDGGPLGMSDLDHNSVVSMVSLKDVDAAAATAGFTAPLNVTVTPLDLPETIQMTNGGTGPLNNSLLLITSGRGPRPPSIALVDPNPPHETTVLLDNFFGRQFNSLNDIKIHPSGKIFFTDSTYGFLNQFRPAPLLPNQVYRLDPDSKAVRVVADGFLRCNGIAFTQDGNTAYVTDTGLAGGFMGNNQTDPSTIYAFDVNPQTHMFENRRVFAYADSGVPDGVQVDTDGNVYSGCADGVQVWSKTGTLLGKFFLGMTSANMVFAGDGRLVILGETKIFIARIAAKGFPLAPV